MAIDVQHLAKLARFRSDGMKKVLCTVLAAALACGLCGCNKDEERISESESSVVSYSETGFDIDRARKSIVVKGQSFEVPKPLNEIKGDWSWKEHENSRYLKKGCGFVYVYFKGEEMLLGATEDYYEGSEEKGIIYNFTIETNDCSIDGFIPFENTKQEVIEKYGEPVSEVSKENYYYYGIVNGENGIGGRLNNHCLAFCFDDNNTITEISVTYADLTKEY